MFVPKFPYILGRISDIVHMARFPSQSKDFYFLLLNCPNTECWSLSCETVIEYLKDNEELENTNEFKKKIKSYIGEREEKMNQVLEYTGYTNYEQLYEDYGETGCVIFKFTK